MTPEQRMAELRELFLTAPAPVETRVLAVVLSLVLVGTVLWLVKRRTLREEYTPIWIGVALGLLVVSIESDILHWLTRTIGAWTPSSTIFFLGEVFLVVICLNFAVRLSRMSLQVKTLSQEVTLLRTELGDLVGGAHPGHD